MKLLGSLCRLGSRSVEHPGQYWIGTLRFSGGAAENLDYLEG